MPTGESAYLPADEDGHKLFLVVRNSHLVLEPMIFPSWLTIAFA